MSFRRGDKLHQLVRTSESWWLRGFYRTTQKTSGPRKPLSGGSLIIYWSTTLCKGSQQPIVKTSCVFYFNGVFRPCQYAERWVGSVLVCNAATCVNPEYKTRALFEKLRREKYIVYDTTITMFIDRARPRLLQCFSKQLKNYGGIVQ